jgi:inner membrane protein
MNYIPFIWLAAGLIICGLEILVTGFVVFWFGVGGVLTALFTYIGVLPTFEIQIIFFFASSLLFLFSWFFFFKKLFKSGSNEDARDPTLDGLKGVVIERIEPGKPGRIRLHKSYHSIAEWKAESGETLEEGADVIVTEARGISLTVKENK